MTSIQTYQEYYPLEPPYVYAGIRFEKGIYIYEVIEPKLDEKEKKILERIKRALYEEADFSSIKENFEEELKKQINRLFKKYKIKLEDYQKNKIYYYIIRDFLKYGKINPLIIDPNVEDISCDGINSPIYIYHKKYENMPTNIAFTDIDELLNFVFRLAYKGNTQLTSARPIVDATLPEGYRAHLTLGEVSKKGPSFTIRKFFIKPITIIDLIKNGVMSSKMAAYLWILIENLRAILIIGATGAGKTTTLNAIATFIPPNAKIVTIEETREINLPHINWIPLSTRTSQQTSIQEISMFELLKASLRQRPNYIIVGEVRGEEAYILVQAIATGHGGLTTFHAENINYAIYRLINKPLNVPTALLPIIAAVIKIDRVRLGVNMVRKITNISEILGYDDKQSKPILNEIYSWNLKNSDLDIYKSKKIEEIANSGRYIDVYEEIKTREKILEWMVRKNLSEFKVVGEIIATYYLDPKKIINSANSNADWIKGI